MKRLLTILLLTATPACAFEDYMIISNSPVRAIIVENPEILNARPIFTIENEKKIILVTPQAKGKTRILVDLFGATKNIEVKVENNSTKLKPQEGFNYFVMDIPPQELPLALPPTSQKGGN